ncbi:putative ribonuclease H-like domain-containing protein [Tanacetum coccineum]
MSEFYEQKGIKREFSVARTPQQNGVAERRNRTLIKVLLEPDVADYKLATTFWAEAVNTACYVQNMMCSLFVLLQRMLHDEPQPTMMLEKKDDEGLSQESGIADQERPKNST